MYLPARHDNESNKRRYFKKRTFKKTSIFLKSPYGLNLAIQLQLKEEFLSGFKCVSLLTNTEGRTYDLRYSSAAGVQYMFEDRICLKK